MTISPALTVVRSASTPETDHAISIKIVSWTFLALTMIAVIARQGIKAFLLRRTTVDDFLILVATAFLIGLSITTIMLASQGLGNDSLTVQQTHFLMKGYYVSNILYIAGICTAKLSILGFFHEVLALRRWARRNVIVTCVLVLAWNMASILAISFQCKIPRPWEMEFSRCFHTQIFWIVYCIVDMSTEVAIIIISVSLVASIEIPLFQKVTAIACFLPRVLVLGAALIRLIWLYPATAHSAPEYQLWIPTIVSQTQLFLSIATACIPYMAPFFKTLGGSSQATSLVTNRDRLTDQSLGRSASSLWSRSSKRTKTLDLWDSDANMITQYKLAPQASPCFPTPKPLTPLSSPVLPSAPGLKSSVRGLNIYIPHLDHRRQGNVDWGSPRTESSGVLSPTCTPQTLLLQTFIPSRKAPSPPHMTYSLRPDILSSHYSSQVPTPISAAPQAGRYSLFPPQHQACISPQPNRTMFVPSQAPPIRHMHSETASDVAEYPGRSSKRRPSVGDALRAQYSNRVPPPKFNTTRHIHTPPLMIPHKKDTVRPEPVEDSTSPMGAAISSWFSSTEAEHTPSSLIHPPSVMHKKHLGHVRSRPQVGISCDKPYSLGEFPRTNDIQSQGMSTLRDVRSSPRIVVRKTS